MNTGQVMVVSETLLGKGGRMTDEERLAVIEARAMGETPIEGQWNYGGVGSRVDYMVIPDHWKDDVVWLIARVRALAARDQAAPGEEEW